MCVDSIYIINEQYVLSSRRKRLPRTCLYCYFFMYISFGYAKKKQKFTAKAALNAIEKSFKCVDRLESIFVYKTLNTKKI